MSREICKYYMHGACNKGAACRFSHDIQAPKSTVCSYYLAGNCSYGDKCRYDHVRPAGHPGAPSGPGRPAPPMTVPRPNMGPPGPGNMTAGAREFVPLNAMMGGMNVGGARPFHPSARAPAWQPPPPSGGYPPAQEEQDDWGYEDEEGNWVSFNEGSGKEEVEFLKSQLPSEDDFLDGLGADTGPHREEQGGGDGGGGGGGGGDEWGYYDDAGEFTLQDILRTEMIDPTHRRARIFARLVPYSSSADFELTFSNPLRSTYKATGSDSAGRLILTCTRSRAEHTVDRSDERLFQLCFKNFVREAVDWTSSVRKPSRRLARAATRREREPPVRAPLARVYNTHL